MSRMTENLNLQRGLLRHLEGLPQVQLLQKTKVQSITRNSNEEQSWPLVHLDNGRVLRSRLLVSLLIGPCTSFFSNALCFRWAPTDSIHPFAHSLEYHPLVGHTIPKPLSRL